jgi:hypothetical protein
MIKMVSSSDRLLKCDLRGNPGYGYQEHKELALAMAKNIEILKQENIFVGEILLYT